MRLHFTLVTCCLVFITVEAQYTLIAPPEIEPDATFLVATPGAFTTQWVTDFDTGGGSSRFVVSCDTPTHFLVPPFIDHRGSLLFVTEEGAEFGTEFAVTLLTNSSTMCNTPSCVCIGGLCADSVTRFVSVIVSPVPPLTPGPLESPVPSGSGSNALPWGTALGATVAMILTFL